MESAVSNAVQTNGLFCVQRWGQVLHDLRKMIFRIRLWNIRIVHARHDDAGLLHQAARCGSDG